MRGGLRLQSNLGKKGFSIVEVLIVLSVTAGLFISAVIMLSGKQRQTEFSTALRDVQTQVQQIISEVGTGFYPSQENFRCTGSLTGPTITSASVTQGENVGCIFLGKVIHFGLADTSPEEYATFSIAGLQRVDGVQANNEVRSLSEAQPTVIAESAANPSAPNGSIQRQPLRAGLKALWVRNGDSPGTQLGAVGFISSLASYDAGGDIVSGSQTVNLMPVTGTSVGATQIEMANAINANLRSSAENPNGGVQICFVSGGTNQSGLMTIGSNGRQLSVKVEVKENDSCNP